MKNALMMRALLFAVTFAVASLPAVSAVPACRFDAVAAGSGKIGQWIDKSNWLAVENQRVSLQAATVFMPAQRLRPATGSPTLRAAVRPLDIDRVEATDPLDGSKRDLAFLLDSRLYADGLVVLHNGRIVVERYRNGLRAGEPRLLLQATRPLLSLLGAVSIGQGKLAGERAVARVIPSLNSHPDLRKLSIQRLLLDHERHAWSAEELDRWRQAAGWSSGPANAGIRSWLAEPGRWDRPLLDHQASTVDGSPDDDLLAWVLAESNATPLAPLFCEQLLSRARPEHPVLWLTDARGVELADGLGLSLRDFWPPRPVVARCTRKPRPHAHPRLVHRDADRLVGQPQRGNAGPGQGQRAALRFYPPRWQEQPGRPHRQPWQQPVRRFRPPPGRRALCHLSADRHAGAARDPRAVLAGDRPGGNPAAKALSMSGAREAQANRQILPAGTAQAVVKESLDHDQG
jgi:hypothetical protein